MKELRFTKQFKKDIDLARRRGKNLSKIKTAMALLAEGDLPAGFKDHALKGNFSDFRECHVEPDWLLIYRLTDIEIQFVRTGSHSDLFR